MRALALTLAATATLAFSTMASASVVLDWSPVATGGNVTRDDFVNFRPVQYFAESFQFGIARPINGIDIYGSSNYGALGDSVVVSIWADGAGSPGRLMERIFTTITELDFDGADAGEHRLHADFTNYLLAPATTYWIGMAGDNIELKQSGLQGLAGGDSRMWVFNARDTNGRFSQLAIGDMAFRLHGTPVANDLPEPGTLALLGIGMAGLAASRRRKAA